MKSRLLFKFLIFLFKFTYQLVVDAQNSTNVQVEFEKYKDDFGREYTNKFEEYKARKHFAATLKMVESHNEGFENGEQPFKMDLNKFADQDPQKIRNFITNPAPQNSMMMMGRAIGVLNETKFPPGPPTVDWRSSGCITPVKDQSFFCNSCYAFSGVAALESQWCLKTGQLVTMSEQQIIDCTYNAITGNWGCGGGSPATAYIYVQNNGIESDVTYPYLEYYSHSNRFPCKLNKSNIVAKTSGYWRIRAYREVQLANIIAAVGPVSAAMNGSTPSFWYYSTGVYSDPQCTPSSSHAVLIVGYGTDYSVTPPMDYWLCKNSWSTEWGDNGYFKIRRGVNMCGITGYLIFPDIPTANITITTTTATMTTKAKTSITNSLP